MNHHDNLRLNQIATPREPIPNSVSNAVSGVSSNGYYCVLVDIGRKKRVCVAEFSIAGDSQLSRILAEQFAEMINGRK